MKPVNNKSLLHFIFDQMEKLDKDEIDVDKAKAQSLLTGKAISIQKLEHDRAKLDMQVREFNIKHGTGIAIRNVELKGFE